MIGNYTLNIYSGIRKNDMVFTQHAKDTLDGVDFDMAMVYLEKYGSSIKNEYNCNIAVITDSLNEVVYRIEFTK